MPKTLTVQCPFHARRAAAMDLVACLPQHCNVSLLGFILLAGAALSGTRHFKPWEVIIHSLRSAPLSTWLVSTSPYMFSKLLDSRSFGALLVRNIVERGDFCSRLAVEHG